MISITVGGGLDWGLIVSLVVGPASAALGVLGGWTLQKRFEAEKWRREVRAALAVFHVEVVEAAFKVDQLVNHQNASPARDAVSFDFPSFREYAAALDFVLPETVYGHAAMTVSAAQDMTTRYRRVATATNASPPAPPDLDDLRSWLSNLETLRNDIRGAARPYRQVAPKAQGN